MHRMIDELLEKVTKKQLAVGCSVFFMLFIAVTIALIVVSVQYDECRNKVRPEKVCPEKVCPDKRCPEPANSKYLRYWAHTIDGNDIGDSEEDLINITTYEDCAKQCDRRNKDCTGFVHYTSDPFDGSAQRCRLKSIEDPDNALFILGGPSVNYYEKRKKLSYLNITVQAETGDEQISFIINGTRYPKIFKPNPLRGIGSLYVFSTRKQIESVKIELLNKVPTDKKKIHILEFRAGSEDLLNMIVQKDNTYVYQR